MVKEFKPKSTKYIEKYLHERFDKFDSVEVHKCTNYILVLFTLKLDYNYISDLDKFKIPCHCIWTLNESDFDGLITHAKLSCDTIEKMIQYRLNMLAN